MARSRAAGEAMQHGGEGPLPRFLLQDPRHVLVGLARMDDQRQPGFARGRDMGAEALLLRRRAGSCRRNNRGRLRRSRRPWDGRPSRPVPPCRYRVPHGRCADAFRPSRTLVEALGDGQQLRQLSHPRRDRDHAADVRPRARARRCHRDRRRNPGNRDGNGCPPAFPSWVSQSLVFQSIALPRGIRFRMATLSTCSACRSITKGSR